ncbi:MAG: hypothetical protein SFX18_17515 [Pirellulales bacterium]|nr:hypothetical protein [Pirellulales bacterium]
MIDFASLADINKIVIPEFFFGPERQVRTAWRKFVRRVWEEKSWDAAVAGCKYKNYWDLQQGNIIISKYGVGLSKNPYWRLDVVQELSLASIEERREHWQKHAALTFQGMDYFWFALANNGLSFNGLDFFDQINRGDTLTINQQELKSTQFYREWFKLYLKWLPEICILSDKLFNIHVVAGQDWVIQSDIITFWGVAISANIFDFRNHQCYKMKNSFRECVYQLYADGLIEVSDERVHLVET